MKALKTIIIIVLVCVVIFICYKAFGKKTEEVYVEAENTNTEVVNEAENAVENEIENEVVNETIVDNTTAVENAVEKDNVYESNSDVGSTNKKEEAINLVKEKWGEDSSASFRCDSVRADGTYIIAVVKGGKVQNYFKVDLNTKTVEVDY